MTLAYFILWLTLNGRVTMEVVAIGLAVSILLDLFVRRVLRVRDAPVSPMAIVRALPAGILYVLVLVREVIKANFAIIRLVLAPDIEVEPCLVRLHTDLESEAARVALANSITLTPGTITVALENGDLLVHALNREMARGLTHSVFENLLHKMELGMRRKEKDSDLYPELKELKELKRGNETEANVHA